MKWFPLVFLIACDYGYPFTPSLSGKAVTPAVGEMAVVDASEEAIVMKEAAAEVTLEATTEAAVVDAGADVAITDATEAGEASDAGDASSEAGDGCAPILHHGGNGPSSWSACYPLATFTQASATDACNAYFGKFYQPGDWSSCQPASCGSTDLVCAQMLGADGGAVNQICWVYLGTLSSGHGPGSSVTTLDPCSSAPSSDAMWQ